MAMDVLFLFVTLLLSMGTGALLLNRIFFRNEKILDATSKMGFFGFMMINTFLIFVILTIVTAPTLFGVTWIREITWAYKDPSADLSIDPFLAIAFWEWGKWLFGAFRKKST